jgi:hypothetical protein
VGCSTKILGVCDLGRLLLFLCYKSAKTSADTLKEISVECFVARKSVTVLFVAKTCRLINPVTNPNTVFIHCET